MPARLHYTPRVFPVSFDSLLDGNESVFFLSGASLHWWFVILIYLYGWNMSDGTVVYVLLPTNATFMYNLSVVLKRQISSIRKQF